MNWSNMLDSFGRELLDKLGYSPDFLPTDQNPITRALEDPGFVEKHKDMTGFSRVGLSRVATICQMTIYDHEGGPEGDRQPKSLRRHWYAWYKTYFAQPLAQQLGDMETNAQGVSEMNDLHWTARLSNTYAEFVDSGMVTYKDLWVEDASRMMESFYERMVQGLNVVICVEKDSLFADFKAAAKAIGAAAVYSGKGKTSKAATEKLLRDVFAWRDGHDPFSDESPLIILTITDYDFDGESVIDPTFGEQARRYTPHILEARVGIKPDNVTAMGHAHEDKWYRVKVSNSGYVDWARHKAMFMAECRDCGHRWPVVGSGENGDLWLQPHFCPACDGEAFSIDPKMDNPHGFEVEALKTRDYYRLIVDALLEVVPFGTLVSALRDECKASPYDAADAVLQEILEENESYQNLLEEFKRLEEIKAAFENEVRDHLVETARPHAGDWRDLEDDPAPDDFRDHVQGARGYARPWMPFDSRKRTEKLIGWLRAYQGVMIYDLKHNHEIEW